jgi:hypothetical protein
LYFGFSSDYTNNVFSKETFNEQYSEIVYKYRVLSKYLINFTYEIISENDLRLRDKYGLNYMDMNGDQDFFYAYYIINTFWLIILSIILLNILENNFKDQTKIVLIYALVHLVLFVSSFVITHYDILSYLILILGYNYANNYDKNKYSIFFISILLLVGTLNRENTALILSYLATLLSLKKGNINKYQKLIFPIISFLIPYIGLRLYFGTTPIDWSLAQYNFTYHEREAGTILFICFSYLIYLLKNNLKPYLRFITFSLPYIVMIFIVGNLHEFRLYVPIIIGHIFLILKDSNNE